MPGCKDVPMWKRDNFSGYLRGLQHHECMKTLVREQMLAAFSDTEPGASSEAVGAWHWNKQLTGTPVLVHVSQACMPGYPVTWP